MEESEAANIKQVIVMRHDLKMRRGKQIAQGAHASMAFLTRRLQSRSSISMDDFSPNEQIWIAGSFAKVCVRCNSEEELMTIHDSAIEMGLEVHLITDTGASWEGRRPFRKACEARPRQFRPPSDMRLLGSRIVQQMTDVVWNDHSANGDPSIPDELGNYVVC